MKKQILFLFLLFSIHANMHAQTPVKELINSYVSSQGSEVASLVELQNASNSRLVAAEIWAIASDSAKKQDKYHVYLIKGLGKKHQDRSTRQSYVRSLISIALNAKEEVSILSLRTLQQFNKKDFDNDSKENIAMIAVQRKYGKLQAIQLLGFIGSNAEIDYIKGIPKFTRLSKQEKYASMLALVRLNDKESTDEYMAELRTREINDNLVVGLLPDMIYTHNKQVYDFLLSDLNNPQPRCRSANNDSQEMILCSYRILEYIADNISGFPIETDGYHELIGDYEQALQKAREWQVKVGTNYIIDNNKY